MSAGAVQDILEQRDSSYGDFDEVAHCTQSLKEFFRRQPNWASDDLTASLSFRQQEALDMFAAKLARILHGDPNHKDSWLDLAGYANLGAGWRP